MQRHIFLKWVVLEIFGGTELTHGPGPRLPSITGGFRADVCGPMI